MERKEAIRSAYRLTGGSNFYDGMITCSTFSGKAVCRLVWDMNKAENDAYLEKAMAGIPENFSGKLLEVPVTEDDFYAGRLLREANIPEEVLIVMIKRHGETIIPRGSTKIKVGDILVVSSESFERFKSGQLKPPQ